jgi:L-ascorbate metabolism protein UlaG (beta-lactamase superfamily)
VDLLMLPVGERLAPRDAVASAQRLNPRVILPMAYRQGEGGGTAAKLRSLDAFVSASPFAVTQKDADIMLISQADLPASTEIWTLKPPQR